MAWSISGAIHPRHVMTLQGVSSTDAEDVQLHGYNPPGERVRVVGEHSTLSATSCDIRI